MPRKAPPAAPPAHSVGNMPMLNGAPIYVKVVIWMLMWFGLPVTMVAAFFFVFIGYLPSPLTEVAESMRMHRREMQDVLLWIRAVDRVQRQICRNTSTDPADRAACNL